MRVKQFPIEKAQMDELAKRTVENGLSTPPSMIDDLLELSKRNKYDGVDTLLARAEQAFKLRQFIHNREQREVIGDYGRDLVGQAVRRIKELTNDPK